MERQNNHSKYIKFREVYKQFTFEGFDIRHFDDLIEIVFHFDIDKKYFFNPTLKVPVKSFLNTNTLSNPGFENVVFHIGMIELISYWKLACPPLIVIKPYIINEEQKIWWKKIYYHGLGEYFYLNSIECSIDDFVTIICDADKTTLKGDFSVSDECLIPIGGGKDSAVTLDLLTSNTKNNLCFILNPRKACFDTAYAAGYTHNEIFIVNRTLDPLLLKLNNEGFLNGHTPFSALLAFVSVMAAILSGKKHIVLSNESSANESTVSDSKINHQYSKSYEFEKDFRVYVDKYVTDSFNYFSLLRSVSELQIGKLFSKLRQYHSIFRSCNVGSKTDSWCCSCSKCLFTYIILSPFLSKPRMVSIFGKDLFADPGLIFEFKQLIGVAETKPFECVGTVSEVNISLAITMKNYIKDSKLPYLLEYYKTLKEYFDGSKLDYHKELYGINSEHFIPKQLINIIKENLND